MPTTDKNSISAQSLIVLVGLLGGCASTKVCFSPEGRCDQVVISHIQQARKQIDVAVYSLTLDSIAEAIISAHNRGIKVRVIIDKQQAGD